MKPLVLSSAVCYGINDKRVAADRLRKLFEHNLPPLEIQKTKPYRPTLDEIGEIYHLLNVCVFGEKLSMPPIKLIRFRGNWGWTIPLNELSGLNTWCEIKLVNRWYCVQWLIAILAHEMAHQYEWDVLGRHLSHGKHFFRWKKRLNKYGIPLKRQYSRRPVTKWKNI